LIYVFDITSTEWEADLKYFDEILTALRENSGDAGVWVLINKMDLADKEDPARKKYEERKADVVAVEERIRRERKEKAGKSGKKIPEGEEGGSIRCFATSIWDESLYKVHRADREY
jgi:Ras-related GTP-binding protein A/B